VAPSGALDGTLGGRNRSKTAQELIAAAHPASRWRSAELAKASAADSSRRRRPNLQPGEGITKIALTVEGSVPGLDEAAFIEAAEGAKENCPVSKALASVPEITLDARLR
jgi:osmotically inducible protein OsmC